MKKVLKILGIILGVVVLAALVGFVVISSQGIPTYETAPEDIQVEVTPEAVERGRKLAMALCINCHKDSETGKAVWNIDVGFSSGIWYGLRTKHYPGPGAWYR